MAILTGSFPGRPDARTQNASQAPAPKQPSCRLQDVQAMEGQRLPNRSPRRREIQRSPSSTQPYGVVAHLSEQAAEIVRCPLESVALRRHRSEMARPLTAAALTALTLLAACGSGEQEPVEAQRFSLEAARRMPPEPLLSPIRKPPAGRSPPTGRRSISGSPAKSR